MSQTLCDGCGLPASDEHIARRLRRLELATRFRPIHIQLLLLAEAPPPRLEDYFYYPARDPSEGGGMSRVLFDSLMQALGIDEGAGKSVESGLGEFQRRGFFLADSCECPIEEVLPCAQQGTRRPDASGLMERYAPTIVKRILYSYKPKHIALLAAQTRPLIPVLQQAGLGDRLLLCQGSPLPFPDPQNPAAQEQFRAGFAEILEKLATKAKTA